VPCHQRNQQQWNDDGMQRVKVDHRSRTNFCSTENHPLERLANARHISQHLGADRDRPIGNLIPRQQVAGKPGQQDQKQQAKADDPV
jgi:hypothetical protein